LGQVPRKRLASLVLGMALVAPLVAACAERGASSVEDAAMKYLAAVRRGDVSALVNLAPEDFEAREAAQGKATVYAAIRGSDSKIAISYHPSDITPNYVVVDFSDSGSTFTDSVPIQRLGGRWYVMLGRAKRGAPPFPTAQPSR